MVQSWTVPYLCPGDGVLQSRELGDQFRRLVLLTYCGILQFKKLDTQIRRGVEFEPAVGRCCG